MLLPWGLLRRSAQDVWCEAVQTGVSGHRSEKSHRGSNAAGAGVVC